MAGAMTKMIQVDLDEMGRAAELKYNASDGAGERSGKESDS
jgi:hypothetical protein